VILSGDTVPCEDSGKDTEIIKITHEGIEIIHQMLNFCKNPLLIYKRNFLIKHMT